MEIRFAAIEDIPGILSLLRQVGHVHHVGRPDIFRNDAQKYGPSQIMSLLDTPCTPIFVAVEGKAVLGYCFCQIKSHFQDPVLKDASELYIDDLCVDEACRGQHIGTALYETANRYGKESGCARITLNVWCCNESALAFYRSLGMTPMKITMEQNLNKN